MGEVTRQPRPLVCRSIEDGTGLHCVDILEQAGRFAWQGCRRDPEDGHGWRVIGAGPAAGFRTADEALADARRSVSWLTDLPHEDPTP